jgi:hypothetical protein
MADKIYIGDIGTKIILNIGTDISAASECKIMYKKPDGTSGEWEADIEDDDQSISYTTEADDLDASGRWKLQAYVSLADWTGLGETAEMVVTNIWK